MRNKIFVKEDFKFDLQRFDSAFSGGDGSQTNPYQIASVEDLQQLANDVNGGNTYYGKYFIVTANIDLSGVANFTPIGDQNTSAFAGTFDGNNSEYTISGMKINRRDFHQGLFGYNSGTIKNVTLLNVDITNRKQNNIGGIAGYNEGARLQVAQSRAISEVINMSAALSATMVSAVKSKTARLTRKSTAIVMSAGLSVSTIHPERLYKTTLSTATRARSVKIGTHA